MAATDTVEWCHGELKTIFTAGLRLDVIKFPEDDEASVKLYYTLTHEQDSNKLRSTSIEHKVKLVVAYQGKVPGGQFKERCSLVVSSF